MTSELLEVKLHDSATLFLGTNSDTSTTFENIILSSDILGQG